MNIHIVSRHAVANYGSLLQALALQRAIQNEGHNAYYIDYCPKRENCYNLCKNAIKRKGWKNPLKIFLYYLIHLPENAVADIKFRKMQKKYLHLSAKKYTCQESISEKEFDKGIFMTGSDQVWNYMPDGELDGVYFLEFVKDSKKVSYAASFGSGAALKGSHSLIKEMLNCYDDITVREADGLNVLNDMGLFGQQVLDPTLLLTREDWEQICSKKKKKFNYVLIYQLHNQSRINQYAKQFAKEKNLKLIRISPMLHTSVWGGSFRYLVNLAQYLWYFKNADYVVTDSFHGTVFSVIFEKKFIEILPPSNIERNLSLLSLLELNGRILKEDSDKVTDREIDYNRVNEILNQERKKSLTILKEMIKE